MKRVVSVSLGSSRRDSRLELELLGERVVVERVGTDGDLRRCAQLLESLDGQVDAIGLGGMDLFLQAGRRRYYLRDAVRVARRVRRTPVVDGSGLKQAWEPYVVLHYLPEVVGYRLEGRRVLQVSSVDRYGMAEAFARAGAQVVYGDFLFALGLPFPLRSLWSVRVLAALLLPFLTQLPLGWLYPTGSRQEHNTPRYGRFFHWAEVVAGDFHFIRRYMPDHLPDKVVLSQTLTRQDVEELRRRGAALLVTVTPELAGRSLGTNVFQALVVAFAGKPPDQILPEEYVEWMGRLGFRPRVEWVNPPRSEGLRALYERWREGRTA
ncbi:MAG: quinate 5-dehydrogenase [Armatimonadota bacterium]|nr:quinate 5-dehydrogenase [Armatimonadota bacterium]MDW8155159.1 quinate 5-dehydrogenase [Armatimonadota bacterium]